MKKERSASSRYQIAAQDSQQDASNRLLRPVPPDRHTDNRATAASNRVLVPRAVSRRSNCWFVCMLKKVSVPLESPIDGYASTDLERRLRGAQACRLRRVVRHEQNVVSMQRHVRRSPLIIFERFAGISLRSDFPGSSRRILALLLCGFVQPSCQGYTL